MKFVCKKRFVQTWGINEGKMYNPGNLITSGLPPKWRSFLLNEGYIDEQKEEPVKMASVIEQKEEPKKVENKKGRPKKGVNNED